MKSIIMGIFGFISVIGYIVLSIAALGVHLLTIFLAWSVGGFISALITLALPFLSEIYWFIRMWKATGLFINNYSIYILLLIVFAVLVFFSAFITSLLDD